MVLPFAPALAPSWFRLQDLGLIDIAPALPGLFGAFFVLGTGMVLQALIFGGMPTPSNIYIELYLKFQLQRNIYIGWGLRSFINLYKSTLEEPVRAVLRLSKP